MNLIPPMAATLGLALLMITACSGDVVGPGDGGAGGQGGAQASCLPDEPSPVELVVVNASSTRLWFKQTFREPRLVLVDGEGEFACPCTADGACVNSAVASTWETYGYLDPGEQVTRTWDGFFFGGANNVPTCDCDVGRLAPAGTHRAEAVAYLYDGCDDDESEFCECSLALGQTCTEDGYSTPLGQPARSANATFTFPDETRVVVTFED